MLKAEFVELWPLIYRIGEPVDFSPVMKWQTASRMIEQKYDVKWNGHFRCFDARNPARFDYLPRLERNPSWDDRMWAYHIVQNRSGNVARARFEDMGLAVMRWVKNLTGMEAQYRREYELICFMPPLPNRIPERCMLDEDNDELEVLKNYNKDQMTVYLKGCIAKTGGVIGLPDTTRNRKLAQGIADTLGVRIEWVDGGIYPHNLTRRLKRLSGGRHTDYTERDAAVVDKLSRKKYVIDEKECRISLNQGPAA